MVSILMLSAGAHARSGGPDDFGYTFMDSDEAGGPVYDWTDISTTGTPTGIDDDGEVAIPLPFTFWFYGQGYSQVTVGDGALLFGDDNQIYNRNDCLPANNREGDDALALPMWDDLQADAAEADDVYWEVQGAAPDRRLVIQYNQVPHYGSDTYYTFQAILEETTNAILFQYESVEGPDAEYTLGGAATIGIQGDLETALEYSCEPDKSLSDGLAILFDVVCDDLDGDGIGACDGDCDDTDPNLGPMATELDDGLDNDCDGLVDEDFVAVGDLVICEMMPDPASVSDEDGEWFEICNVTDRDIDIQGWSFTDSGGSVSVESSVVVPAGGYVVLAANADPATNGGLTNVAWVFDWDRVHLNNSGDSLSVGMGGTIIDQLSYQDWSVPTGTSMFLDSAFIDADINDDPVAWCDTPMEAAYSYGVGGGGDFGTPGAENPQGLCCHDNDTDGWDICTGDCDDDDPERFPENPELADLLDNDCDYLADEDWVTEGSIVITEFMDDPYVVTPEHGEWFEIYNAGGVDLNLNFWEIGDQAGNGFVIDRDVVIPAGGYAIFAVDDDPASNGNLPRVDFEYSYYDFALESFEDDAILLKMGDMTVDQLEYANEAPWPNEMGRSTYLCPGLEISGGSNAAADWAATPMDDLYDFGASGSGDYGTPGEPNAPDCVSSQDSATPDTATPASPDTDQERDSSGDDSPEQGDTAAGKQQGCEGCSGGGPAGSPGIILAGLVMLLSRRPRSRQA